MSELPDGYRWEYREGMDGACSIGHDKDGKPHSWHRPATQYRRAVGPWQIITPAEAIERYWKPETMPDTMKRLA